VPDLTDVGAWIKRIVFRLDRLEGGAMLENASITNGRVRFIGGKLLGLAGAAFEWIGSFDLTGPFTAIGTAIFRGPVSITGEDGTLDVEADASFGGDVAITQKLDVTAEATFRALTKILGDLRVEENGKVYVGTAMVFDPSVESGAIVFQNGAQVFTNGDSIQVYKGNSVVQLEDDSAKLQYGGTAIVIDEDGIHFYGPVIAHNLPTIDEDANAVADDDGRLGKTAD
jgi:hypothetical protein